MAINYIDANIDDEYGWRNAGSEFTNVTIRA